MGRVRRDPETFDMQSDRTLDAYEEQLLLEHVREAIANRRAEVAMSQKALADALGVSEGRVSQVLSGAENVTLRTLAKVMRRLGARVHVEIVPIDGRATNDSGPVMTAPSADGEPRTA